MDIFDQVGIWIVAFVAEAEAIRHRARGRYGMTVVHEVTTKIELTGPSKVWVRPKLTIRRPGPADDCIAQNEITVAFENEHRARWSGKTTAHSLFGYALAQWRGPALDHVDDVELLDHLTRSSDPWILFPERERVLASLDRLRILGMVEVARDRVVLTSLGTTHAREISAFRPKS